ncbi:hypothetical protein [Actinoplanes sp. RD1]|uniref:hypothetical protein n=1 Tax=Actinoplanes sp. RD1 TaxID=3064538 RepID=UPI002740DD5E|nr:hypothetical protein [Actinoplanes sp. RD1]
MRDAVTPVRDAVTPVRDAVTPVRDAVTPVRDAAAPVSDAASWPPRLTATRRVDPARSGDASAGRGGACERRGELASGRDGHAVS